MSWLEIEKKFLIPELSLDLGNYKYDEIEQWYFVLEKDVEERVRHRWNKYYHTKKVWHWEVREEYENEITKEEFEEKWKETEWKRIQKTRYLIPYNNHIIELDVYHWVLAWLVTAEIEFDSKEDCDSFVFPEWFGEDVTEDTRFKNRNLIFEKYSDLN